MKKPLNQVAIKYILITVMTLDHISGFLGESHPLYLPFRFVSRLTGPTMVYFLVEGYQYTRNLYLISGYSIYTIHFISLLFI